jgi:hypothetical protein
MKRPVCTSHGSWITAAGRIEVDGIRGGAALGDHLGEVGRPVLPDEQHRPLGRVALVADVGGHGGHVAGLHDDARPPGARLLVGDVPLDLVGQLHEPLDPVVAVDDRQDVLLGGRAVEAVFAHRYDRRVPRHVGTRQVGEQVEGGHLVLEAGLGVDLGLRLVDVGEHAVDRMGGVGAERLVARHADHALRRDPPAADGRGVAPGFVAPRGPRLLGRSEGIEPRVGPLVEHRHEGGEDVVVREVLEVVELGTAVGVVERAGEQVDVAVMVDRAEHVVEVHDAVEELPGDVALCGPQEGVDRHHVAARGPGDVGEILVAAEGELAEREAAVAVGVGLAGTDGGGGGGCSVAHVPWLLRMSG